MNLKQQRKQGRTKLPQYSVYTGKFFGVTQSLCQVLTERTNGYTDAARGLHLLLGLTMGSSWDFRVPEGQFRMPMAALMKELRWSYRVLHNGLAVLQETELLKVIKTKRGHIYKLNCELAGLRPGGKQGKGKKPYIKAYTGVTRVLLENLREKLPNVMEEKLIDGWKGLEKRQQERNGQQLPHKTKHGQRSSSCLWVLVNMLVHAKGWSMSKPVEPIKMSVRRLADHTNMSVNTAIKYRDMLIDAGFISLYQPGGRNRAALYALDVELAGLRAAVVNPTPLVDLKELTSR